MGNVEKDTGGKSVLFIPFLAFSASKKAHEISTSIRLQQLFVELFIRRYEVYTTYINKTSVHIFQALFQQIHTFLKTFPCIVTHILFKMLHIFGFGKIL